MDGFPNFLEPTKFIFVQPNEYFYKISKQHNDMMILCKKIDSTHCLMLGKQLLVDNNKVVWVVWKDRRKTEHNNIN